MRANAKKTIATPEQRSPPVRKDRHCSGTTTRETVTHGNQVDVVRCNFRKSWALDTLNNFVACARLPNPPPVAKGSVGDGRSRVGLFHGVEDDERGEKYIEARCYYTPVTFDVTFVTNMSVRLTLQHEGQHREPAAGGHAHSIQPTTFRDSVVQP